MSGKEVLYVLSLFSKSFLEKNGISQGKRTEKEKTAF